VNENRSEWSIARHDAIHFLANSERIKLAGRVCDFTGSALASLFVSISREESSAVTASRGLTDAPNSGKECPRNADIFNRFIDRSTTTAINCIRVQKDNLYAHAKKPKLVARLKGPRSRGIRAKYSERERVRASGACTENTERLAAITLR